MRRGLAERARAEVPEVNGPYLAVLSGARLWERRAVHAAASSFRVPPGTPLRHAVGVRRAGSRGPAGAWGGWERAGTSEEGRGGSVSGAGFGPEARWGRGRPPPGSAA